MHALSDVLIAGCEVTANREELTFAIHGGREHAYQVLRLVSLFTIFHRATHKSLSFM